MAIGHKVHKVNLGSHGTFESHKGGLHDALGIPRDEKLTAAEKEPKPGDSSHLKHMKASAKGFAAMHH